MAAREGWLTPSARGTLQLTVQVALSLALFVVLQFLATRHNVRFDLTPTQSFVLSQQARQVAAKCDKPVQITVFYSSQESGQRRQFLDLLEQFRAASSMISFRLLDLDRSPGLAKKYGITSYKMGVLEVGDRVVTLRSVDEGEITNALLVLSQNQPRTLCFVTGHGERSPTSNDERSGYSEVGKALERENFTITTLSIIPRDGVPAPCTVVVLAGPSHDFLPGEADALTRYFRNGGKVLLMVDPDAPPSVLAFLRGLGAEAGNNLIVDESNRFVGADSFMPQVLRFRTELFRDTMDAPAVLSLARTVRPLEETPAGLRAVSIATTSPDSWARVGGGPVPADDVRFRRNLDEPGPLSVAVSITHEPSASGADSPPGGHLIALGDSDFATNFYLNLLGNKDFFMSTIAVLAENPQLVAARRKGLPRGTISPISLTAWQGRVIFWVAVVAQPAAFVLVGAGVVLMRLRRRGGR